MIPEFNNLDHFCIRGNNLEENINNTYYMSCYFGNKDDIIANMYFPRRVDQQTFKLYTYEKRNDALKDLSKLKNKFYASSKYEILIVTMKEFVQDYIVDKLKHDLYSHKGKQMTFIRFDKDTYSNELPPPKGGGFSNHC